MHGIRPWELDHLTPDELHRFVAHLRRLDDMARQQQEQQSGR